MRKQEVKTARQSLHLHLSFKITAYNTSYQGRILNCQTFYEPRSLTTPWKPTRNRVWKILRPILHSDPHTWRTWVAQ